MAEVMQRLYPSYPWDPSKFIGRLVKPVGHWQDKENLFKMLEEAERKLGITKVATRKLFYYLHSILFCFVFWFYLFLLRI